MSAALWSYADAEMARVRQAPPGDTAVLWHDVECGSYSADLPLWRELADRSEGPVLDLGCGTGRVALYLAERGHEVTGVDVEPQFVDELRRRARARALSVTVVLGDVRELRLEGSFALALAPMQLLQILGGPSGRRAMLRGVGRYLAPGGRFAAAITPPAASLAVEDEVPPLPDVLERDGWVLSSYPLEVRLEDGGVAVERLRALVSPTGELREELNTVRLDTVTAAGLEVEGREAGLAAAGLAAIPETADHVGSTVVLLERPA
jgi:SAM-dependent methyltransferase